MKDMTKNAMKAKMRSGEKVLGTFFEMGGGTAVECLGLAGLDFFIIDTEHGPFDVESAVEFIRAAGPYSISPLVRVKDATRSSILKMLDIGAQGLIVPCIRTADEVKQLVEYGKYYPLGRRGFAATRVASFGFNPLMTDLEAWFARSNEETMIIPQCETSECLDSIGEIAAIEGVDGIFVGPYDLSVALGKPGRFDDPECVAAVDRILRACRAAGKFSFIYTGDANATKKYFADGFDGVACGMDTMFCVNAYKNLITNAKP
jgi:4-hydroxy-2-oxoheptanedioate aldolase